MFKIIFIDIDGPLSYGTWGDGPIKIDDTDITIPYAWIKEDCDALIEIIEQTNALLVVSSDWRKYYGINQLRMIFQHYGIYKYNVLDITTHFNPRQKLSSSSEFNRACEIQTWVKSFKPTNWVAIDDMNLSAGFQSLRIPKWRHIQTDGDFGVGGKLRDKIDIVVERLNRPVKMRG